MREDLKVWAFLTIRVGSDGEGRQVVQSVDITDSAPAEGGQHALVDQVYALDYPKARYKLLPRATELAKQLRVKLR